MAERFEVAVVACPASTPTAAPREVPLNFPGGILRGFEIIIPAGHSGLTGIALGYGHGIAIPGSGASFFSGDDDVIRRVYQDKTPGVPWSAFVVNLDLQVHTWEVRFDYDELSVVTPAAAIQPIAPEDILAAGVDALTET